MATNDLVTPIRSDRLPRDVILQFESATIADVICSRCDAIIGRLQTIPVEPEADMEEIYSEISLIAEEHRPACAAAANDDR